MGGSNDFQTVGSRKRKRCQRVFDTKSNKFKVDDYYEGGADEPPTAIEFNGCLWHSFDECYSPGTHSPFSNNNMRDLYLQQKQKEYLLSKSGCIVESIWECEWKRMRKEDDVKRVLYELRAEGVIVTSGEDEEIGCYSSGIVPRDALYGGRTGNTSIYQSVKKKRFGSRIRYYDIKSLSPDVMRNGEYPVGFPEVKRRDFDYSENAYFGLMKVKMIPPKKLFHPVLPYRVKRKNETKIIISVVSNMRRTK